MNCSNARGMGVEKGKERTEKCRLKKQEKGQNGVQIMW